MSPTIQWKRGEDRSLIHGDWEIVVVGETPSCKATDWSIRYKEGLVPLHVRIRLLLTEIRDNYLHGEPEEIR